MLKLDGKNVLITGASSGIGQAIAVRFAQEGANVAINYRSGAEQAEATAPNGSQAACADGSGPRRWWCRRMSPDEEQVQRMFAARHRGVRHAATCW